MKKLCIWVIILSLGFSGCFWAKKSNVRSSKKTVSYQTEGILVRRILLDGFILEDKKALENIIKPRQNKYLTQDQITQIIEEIKSLYLQAGYPNLVNFRYELAKGKLTIHINLKE